MAEEINKEKQTPTTYTYYDKQYNYDDLERSVYEGLNSYLSGLKRGEKDEQLFRNAASNMLAGIKDGTITWSDGRFKDSKGRYSNGTWYDENNVKQSSKKKSKDYYGLVANYIYKNLGQSGEYKPEEKKPWDSNAAMTSALMQEIFNSDKGNMADFYGLDSSTKTNTNRVKALYNALTNIKSNWQTKMSKYNPTEEDYNAYLPYLDAAINALSDNKIGDDEYLTLSRAINGMDWRSMLSNKPFEEKSTEQQNQQVVSTGNSEHDAFNQYVSTNFKEGSDSIGRWNLNSNIKFGNYTENKLYQVLANASEDELNQWLDMGLSNKNLNFTTLSKFRQAVGGVIPTFTSPNWMIISILEELGDRGLLQQDSQNKNIYYLTGVYDTKNNAAYYYDLSTKTLNKTYMGNIPYWQDQMYNQWKSTLGQHTWTDRFFTESNK